MIKKLFACVCLMPLFCLAFAKTHVWGDNLYIDGELRSALLFAKDMPYGFLDVNHPQQSYIRPTSRLFFGLGWDVNENINLFAQGVYWTIFGTDQWQKGASASELDKLQLLQGYGELKNILGFFDIKLGRFLVDSEEIFFNANYATFERLVYYAFDGAQLTVNAPTTTAVIIYGREAQLSALSFSRDFYHYGLTTDTKFNENTGFNGYFYNTHEDGGGDEGIYGIKPYIDFETYALSLKYLRSYAPGFTTWDTNGQLVRFDAHKLFSPASAELKARIMFMSQDGGPTYWGVDMIKSLIVDQMYDQIAFHDTNLYNLGLDISPAAMSATTFAFDAYYYQGGSSSTPDKGLEFNLQIKRAVNKFLDVGVSGAYLFANRDFQPHDAMKLVTWFVVKF